MGHSAILWVWRQQGRFFLLLFALCLTVVPAWAQMNEEAILYPDDPTILNSFGVSVSIDGNVAIVGAPHDPGNGWSGAAYIFRFDPVQNAWCKEIKLIPFNGEPGSHFGSSVGFFGDVAVIGAEESDDNGSYSGSAYIFDLHRYPLLDIACNGEDQDVIVSGGEAVTLTIDVAARNYTGFSADIWVIGTSFTGGGSWTYGYHGAPSWAPGISKVYFSGGLFDFSATILDRPLPVGMYIAWLAVDLEPDGWLDMDDLFDYDSVNFVVVP